MSDTGPILHLGEIDSLVELRQFGKVVISDTVQTELSKHDVIDAIKMVLSDTLEIHRIKPSEINVQRAVLSGFMLHNADLSIAALASSLCPDVVLTDDLELRKALESRGSTVVGSIGILFRSFSSGRLNKDELRILLEHLLDDSTLYLSQGIKRHVFNRLDAL